ncbi:hypothetical protein OK349_18490 [Sphingomonas sp. BT-65]|uniref:hypothetical protein n=1 Tax=Sphingomonas sp. BT-65 TaxID=2989821 RepID=UPI002236AC33|nr:hypothetical protein [Sphingomonas sp. BT-65]MCW4463699.1 hypothetical protein [Sphingomonas sp. BT-65]
MSLKTLWGLIAGLVPVVWFGGLAIHFYRVNEAMGGFASRELMPTIVGLGGLGLLFTIPILIQLVRLVSGSATKPKELKAPVAADDAAASDFDADAVIARYLEKKAAGEASFEVPDNAAPRPTFGRKV